MMEMDESDEIVTVAGDDEGMVWAINTARQSLKQFLNAYFAPKPNQRSFLLKVVFEEQDEIEHIWLADLDLHSSSLTGMVANEPGIRSISFMQRVTFEAKNITDWMYCEDDCLIGAFTTRVLKKSARPN